MYIGNGSSAREGVGSYSTCDKQVAMRYK